MLKAKDRPDLLSDFLQYLAKEQKDGERLPSLADLSQQLGISTASLREQLEVARSLGVVEVRPKTGIRRLPYSFKNAVCQSLAYGISVAPDTFDQFYDLRRHVEAAYWLQAVNLLTCDDIAYLYALLERADKKLNGRPVQIPHEEHRELHLCLYRRVNNVFVTGILESYWEMYEAIGLNVYTDFLYLRKVWDYHRTMVDAIKEGRFEEGYRLLLDHMNLLRQRFNSEEPITAERE